VTNQNPANTTAGSSKKNGKNRIGMTTRRASGNMSMKPPSTPEIAPEAPSDGMAEVGLKIAWVSEANSPQAR
jgi:hypothetical protein